MPKFNWRSLDDTYYDQIEQAEMTGMAWECLRRNATFERDYQTIQSSGRSISDGFRQHWGLVFRSRPRTILSRADYLLGSRGRADDYTGSSLFARRILFPRPSGSQQTNRRSTARRSGWLARRPLPPWRGASYLVQTSANPRRCLHGRATARPRFRIQGECRYALVARAQWTTPRCAFACDFSASPAANCACPACVGRAERRCHIPRDRRSDTTQPAHPRARMANA